MGILASGVLQTRHKIISSGFLVQNDGTRYVGQGFVYKKNEILGKNVEKPSRIPKPMTV